MQQSTRNPSTVQEFEADSVEQALEQVTSTLGSDARIVDVERITRGGVGGFFAREAVVVRATPAPPTAAGTEPTGPNPEAAERVAHATTGGIDAVLTSMAAEQDAAERDFRARLERQLNAQDADQAAGERFEAPTWPRVEDAAAPREPSPATSPPAATPSAGTSEASVAAAQPTAVQPTAAPPAVAPPATVEVAHEDVDDADVEVVEATEARLPERNAPARVERPSRPEPRPLRRVEPPARRAALPAPSSLPAPSPTPIAQPSDAPAGAGPVDWSALNLQRIGLPASVVDAVHDLRSTDDFVWLRAIAGAVKLFCRPLPTGASMLAGPRGKRLALALDLPAVKKGEAPPYGGHVGIQCKDHKTDRAWLSDVAGERWLHVVIGGHGWQGLLFDDPLAVSWVGNEELPEALDLCAKLGLVLGFGMSADTKDATALRATPFEVALAIRSLLPRR